MPKELGGGGYSMLQQVLVQEQGGRATNALGWVLGTPPAWLPPVATPDQIERYVIPAIRAEKEECYAITEDGAGSDVDAIVATARWDGDDYILDGVKWHVTSYNSAAFAFFQAKLTAGDHAGEHAMFIVDLPSDGVRVVRTPAYTHTINHHHPIVAFESVRVPASQMVGAEGDGMAFAYEWFRYERIMVASRCLGGAARLIDDTTEFAKHRIVNGHPITEFGAVEAMLADSLTELFAARCLVYETAKAIDAGADSQGPAHPVLHGQALRLGDGRPGGRPLRPDLRRPRLHARERGRALLPRAPGGEDLGRDLRGPTLDHRQPDGQAGTVDLRLISWSVPSSAGQPLNWSTPGRRCCAPGGPDSPGPPWSRTGRRRPPHRPWGRAGRGATTDRAAPRRRRSNPAGW